VAQFGRDLAASIAGNGIGRHSDGFRGRLHP
jgi:hypothetical protein